MVLTIRPKIQVAKEFSTLIRKALTADALQQVIERNKSETNYGVCHSHDFVDANQYMATAFTTIMGREPDFDDPTEIMIINDAWSIAKGFDFGFSKG